MYQVNQRCRFLSWTGTMNRCYWCILGLHAHAIYSDVISFCTERVLQGNTVDHYRRSWIYYSFSTSASKFLRPIYHVKSVEKQTIKPEKHHCVLPHYLRTNKSLPHKPSHKELTRTGLDYSLTKRRCAKMQTKNSVLSRFNFAKYEARSKLRKRASNLRSWSFAIERIRVTWFGFCNTSLVIHWSL